MKNRSVFWLVLTSLLATLTFISSFIRIPIGPVPFTLQTVFVMLAGLVLPPPHAALSQVLNFLLMTLFVYGASIFVTPTCGFLLGFIVMAWLLALTKKKFLPLQLILAEILLYIIGLSYLWYTILQLKGTALGLMKVLEIGLLPFILPDIAKIFLALLLYKRLKPILAKKINQQLT